MLNEFSIICQWSKEFSLYIFYFLITYLQILHNEFWAYSLPPTHFRSITFCDSSKFVFCFSPIESNLCCSYIQGFMRSAVICFTCSTTFYYKIILKTFFPHFIYVSQFPIPPSTFHLLPTFCPPQPPIHNSERVRFPKGGGQQSLTPHFATGQRPFPRPYLSRARYAYNKNGLQNTSSSTIDKPWPHFQ